MTTWKEAATERAAKARPRIQGAIDKAVAAGWSIVPDLTINREMKQCCPLGAALIDRPRTRSIITAGRMLGVQAEHGDMAWFALGFDIPGAAEYNRAFFLLGRAMRQGVDVESGDGDDGYRN